MDVVVAGAHGQIALLLLPRLTGVGHRVRGLIRNPDHALDVEALGAEPVLCDMEEIEDLGPYVEGADAIVFAAGAGPGSGAERKRTVDLGAAVKLVDAAEQRGVSRFLIVSAIAADEMAGRPGDMQPYFQAKADADDAVRASSLHSTIVRPGGLTDDAGLGLVEARIGIQRGGEIPREDVAAVLAACLDAPSSIGKTFDLVSGDVPIADAVASL